MELEYNSLIENNTWQLVSRPKDKKVLKNKWVFKVKRQQYGSIEKYKARLVARGDQQREGIDFDEVFSPITRLETIRTLFAVSVTKGMHIHQMDVITAHVQRNLHKEIFMEQPKMFERFDAQNTVYKLNKPLYGLKQADRKLDNFLVSLDFNKTAIDPCVYVSNDKNSDAIITALVYVDDLLITSVNLEEIEKINNSLKREFKIKDLGMVQDILGMSVERVGSLGSIKVSQEKYVKDLLERFGMTECNTISVPMENNINIETIKSETDRDEIVNKPYRELVGSLNHLANSTRPDIAFAANVLSRFNACPKETHWKMAKRVLRYLKGTIDYSIKYEDKNSPLLAYVDSDWAGDANDRKSCSGYVLKLAGGPINWKSKKQRSVALSTMEAEYMALSQVTKEIIYASNLLKHMKIYSPSSDPTTVHCDNLSAVGLSKNSVYHGRSKHINIRYHFSREAQEQGEIVVKHLRTSEMTADVLTKPLDRIKHETYVRLLNLD